VDEHHARFEPSVTEASGRQLNEVLQLGRHLDAGRSPTNDDKGQKPLPADRVRLDARLLEHVERAVAQVEGVAQRPDAHRVFCHPGNRGQIGHAAHRDDQRVVLDRAQRATQATPEADALVDDVDRLDGPDLDLAVRQHPAKRHDHVGRLDRPGDDVGEQRLEDEVVVAADEQDLDAVLHGRAARHGQTAFTSEAIRQLLCSAHACEPAPEDDDPFGHGW
jgi:hypothetical protein